jgi:ferric-dicitrate binding protein FerR (iron transport regulator)
MSMRACPRIWEVEAARDGRLQGSAHAEFLRHVALCRDCEHERAALSSLQHALCASTTPDDAVQLRRVRQRTLAAANQRVLGQGPRAIRWGAVSLSVAAVVVLSGLWLYLPEAWRAGMATGHPRAYDAEPDPIALRLSADKGARFEHERRGDLEYVKLHDGSLHVTFDRSLHVRLSVQTPDGEIEDIGTVFQVEVEGGYTQRIRVSKGAVRFRRAGQPDVMLTSGQVFERTPSAAVSAPEPPQVARSAPADLPVPVQPAPSVPTGRPTAHAHLKSQPEPSSTAEDRAYLEVLELLHAERQEEARAAARRYCRNHPNGLRLKELEHLARSAEP